MKHIQGDTLDLDAAALMDVLRTRLPREGRSAQAARYLATWHGDMAADNPAASIFHAWMRHLRQRAFGHLSKRSWESQEAGQVLDNLSANVTLAELTRLLRQGNEDWCSTGAAATPRSCAALLATSQTDALDELHKLRGDWSMRSWRWGDMQHTKYAHTPLSQIKPLRWLFERRIGNGGSSNSINVASSRFVEGKGYVQTFGPGFRQVIELGPKGIRHEYMNSTGQSGNFLSRHYDDMIEPFRDVKYAQLTAPTDREAIPGKAKQPQAGHLTEPRR
jgi:penicillin amidase